MTSATDDRTTELEQSKYKPPYDARPMRMLRHHIECDCLASRRGVLREIEDLFAVELTKRDERIAELEQAIAATLGSETCMMETDSEELEVIASSPEDTWGYRCRACGWTFRYERGIKPRFCPDCRREVVDA